MISYKSTGNSTSDTPKPRKSTTIPSTTGPGVDVHALARNILDDSDLSRHVCSHHRQQMVDIVALIKGYMSRCVSLTSECQGNFG